MPSMRAIAAAAYRAINDDDFEAFLEWVAEDVEFTSLVAEAEGMVYRGHAGAREWWNTVRTAFDDGRWEMVDLEEAGSHAVARIHITGTIRGVPVEQTMWQAIERRGDQAGWWAFFREEREARAAVGWPASPS